jgi:hypothetical protein
MMAQALLGHICHVSMAAAGYGNGGLYDSDELNEVING